MGALRLHPARADAEIAAAAIGLATGGRRGFWTRPTDVGTTGPHDAMATATTADALHVCDGCLSTVLCGDGALVARWGWKHLSGKDSKGKGWKLLLCADCKPEEEK